jgi:hypothetical protein
MAEGRFRALTQGLHGSPEIISIFYKLMLSRCCLRRNHHATLAAWRLLNVDELEGLTEAQRVELEAIIKLQLQKPGDTRFCSAFLMLERVLKVEAKLQQLVVSDRWLVAVRTLRAADQVSTEDNI